MKALIIKIIACFLILGVSTNLFSQEIQFNSNFTSDTVLFPFEQIDIISSMTIDGEVHLHQDTSLVRVLLEDESGYQYMIIEAYPLIFADSVFTFTRHCDETCLLDQANPYSLNIQIIDGSLNLKSLYYDKDPKENASEERFKAKRALDVIKIEEMNVRIPAYNMSWTAGDNEVIAMYYDQKRQLYGDRYNLRGYDYYSGGVFEFLGHVEYPQVDPNLVKEFDWRNRHGINDSTSLYWDGDVDKAGWLTEVKNQKKCGSCWAFASAGVVEALVNLYTARPIDLDLSEQELVCNDETAMGCKGSFHAYSGLIYIKNHGIFEETCLPYDTTLYDTSCVSIQPCSNPNPIIKIEDTLYYNSYNEKNYDTIRKALITKGPLKISFPVSDTSSHAVVLSGFKFNLIDSTLTFIIKDSHGNTGLERGFMELKLANINYAMAAIPPVYKNDTGLIVSCNDFDKDGYFFWGIGEKPDTCNCDTIEDCDDNNRFVGGYDENYNCSCIFSMDSNPHYISADTTWSDTTYVNFQVIIDSGACLTISAYAAFAPEAGILVRKGGKLILDSAYLTKVCPDLWQGIDVLGSDTIQDYDEYFGKVVVRNNSIIEFAEVGIANHCRTCGYQDMQCGGIISAENSIFRDNVRDILLNPYSTYWFGHDLPYACTFENCQFITTDLLYPENIPVAHIEMKNINGVMLYGCTFINESTALNPINTRGTGISSIDSYFMLYKYCNTNIIPCNDWSPCEFTSLDYGIKALNSKTKRTLEIKDVKFTSNYIGVSLSGIDNAAILSNRFINKKMNEDEIGDRFIGGLFLEGSTAYHVEANEFSPPLMSGSGISYGIGVKNSGPDNNEIYNNTFTNLQIGVISLGENRGRESGLCLKCNDMNANTNDFMVFDENDPPLGIYQGINHYQGDPADSTSFDAPAGNTFTSFPPDSVANPMQLRNYNYLNDGEDLWYTHHALNQYELVRPLDSNYTWETIELKGWTDLEYFKETACPSGLGGGGGTKSSNSPKSIINECDIQIDSLNIQLALLIDGGNTEELNFEVMTSMPDEGLEMRQELLAESPYLSDTVMKQAIYKEDVLPNAMIRDILEANPQSAKSSEILTTLDSRFEPMPDYMMTQIMQGRKYLGAKEMLEAKIQSWKQIRAKAKADLMRGFLLDTTMINPLDSIIAYLENETDPDSKYDLALVYWNKQDTANAMLTIDGIPSQFTLSDYQSVVHQQYIDFFEILQQIEDSSWRACDLDSSSVQDLFDLMEDGDVEIAAHARGMLVKGGFLDYIETVNLPDYSKSSGPFYNSENPSTKEPSNDYLRLFPNPAGDYIIAYFDVESKWQNGMITIYDMKGNLLRKYTINSGQNQMVLDLKALPNGIYIMGLYANDRLIEVKKFSKGRY